MTTNNGAQGGKWLTIGTKSKGNNVGGQEGTFTDDTGDTGDSPGQVAVEMRENGNTQGRINATNTNKANEDDGMQSYNVNTGYMEVRLWKHQGLQCRTSAQAVFKSHTGAGRRIYEFAFGRYW
jgi:hypothetical protein